MTLESLLTNKSKAKATAVSVEQAKAVLPSLSGWELKNESITKVFKFENYYQTIAFVNATAWISHNEDHHPDLEVGYNKCHMRYSTHSVGGLSENDFICAAKVEQMRRLTPE